MPAEGDSESDANLGHIGRSSMAAGVPGGFIRDLLFFLFFFCLIDKLAVAIYA